MTLLVLIKLSIALGRFNNVHHISTELFYLKIDLRRWCEMSQIFSLSYEINPVQIQVRKHRRVIRWVRVMADVVHNKIVRASTCVTHCRGTENVPSSCAAMNWPQ